MLILPIQTRLLHPSDLLADVLRESADIRPDDIIVVSSKAMATVEGRLIDLRTLEISAEAQGYSRQSGRSPAFCEAVLRETNLRNGTVLGAVPGAMLTELRPEGLPKGVIITANAGMDESNVAPNFAVGWPQDPTASAKLLRERLGDIAVIVSDSCCVPRRSGVTAYALAVSGINPLKSLKGSQDLHGNLLKITVEAVADQLATAANFVMGNAAESVPAAIIREHGLVLTHFAGWVPGIEPDKDLFQSMLP